MIKKKKKTILLILIGINTALFIFLIMALILFWNELRSLMSLKKIDHNGMYHMKNYGA